MAELHFGWVVPLEISVDDFLALEERILPAVARHFDSLWVYDHFYASSNPSNPYLECWTALTWLASHTQDLQLGTLVLGVGYRNPALVAKMGATLHALSGNRFVMGIGAGWRGEEYRAYGYPFPPPAERVRQLEEAVQIIRRMWAETSPSYHGQYYTIQNAYCSPRPEPPPPILIGGEGEQLMLPLVGRLADWWNCGELPDLDSYRRKRDIVLEHARRAGRDASKLILSFHQMNRPFPDSPATAQAWVNHLQPLVEEGFTHFMIDAEIDSPGVVERFTEQVIGKLKS